MKRKKSKKERLDMEAKRLSNSYIFVLSSLIILFVSIKSFNFYIFGVETNYSIFIVPFIFFLNDAILKEVGYKEGLKGFAISIITLFIMSIISDLIFGIEPHLLKYLGVMLSYTISGFLNLSIYYYMLENYSTPYFFVVLNFIFVALVFNMLNMLFVEHLVFSDNFWTSYMVIIVIQILLSMICAIILKWIRQGVDIDE